MYTLRWRSLSQPGFRRGPLQPDVRRGEQACFAVGKQACFTVGGANRRVLQTGSRFFINTPLPDAQVLQETGLPRFQGAAGQRLCTLEH